jgi:hypothetical protein
MDLLHDLFNQCPEIIPIPSSATSGKAPLKNRITRVRQAHTLEGRVKGVSPTDLTLHPQSPLSAAHPFVTVRPSQS